MPAWLIGLVAPAFDMILNIFKSKHKAQADAEVAKQEANKAKALADAAKATAEKSANDMNATLGTENLRGGNFVTSIKLGILVILLGLVGFAAFAPDILNHLIENVQKVFNNDFLYWIKKIIDSIFGTV